MFSEFWNIYPRKVAKKYALQCWNRLTHDQQKLALDAISVHVKVWTAEGRQISCIPHASSWLNGERWEDELEMPTPKGAEWWATQAGIEKKARELGLWPPRVGESWHELKARINARLAA